VVTNRKKRDAAAGTGTERLKIPLLKTGVSGLICQSTGGVSEAASSSTNPAGVSDQLRPKVRLPSEVVLKLGRNGDEVPP